MQGVSTKYLAALNSTGTPTPGCNVSGKVLDLVTDRPNYCPTGSEGYSSLGNVEVNLQQRGGGVNSYQMTDSNGIFRWYGVATGDSTNIYNVCVNSLPSNHSYYCNIPRDDGVNPLGTNCAVIDLSTSCTSATGIRLDLIQPLFTSTPVPPTLNPSPSTATPTPTSIPSVTSIVSVTPDPLRCQFPDAPGYRISIQNDAFIPITMTNILFTSSLNHDRLNASLGNYEIGSHYSIPLSMGCDADHQFDTLYVFYQDPDNSSNILHSLPIRLDCSTTTHAMNLTADASGTPVEYLPKTKTPTPCQGSCDRRPSMRIGVYNVDIQPNAQAVYVNISGNSEQFSIGDIDIGRTSSVAVRCPHQGDHANIEVHYNDGIPETAATVYNLECGVDSATVEINRRFHPSITPVPPTPTRTLTPVPPTPTRTPTPTITPTPRPLVQGQAHLSPDANGDYYPYVIVDSLQIKDSRTNTTLHTFTNLNEVVQRGQSGGLHSYGLNCITGHYYAAYATYHLFFSETSTNPSEYFCGTTGTITAVADINPTNPSPTPVPTGAQGCQQHPGCDLVNSCDFNNCEHYGGRCTHDFQCDRDFCCGAGPETPQGGQSTTPQRGNTTAQNSGSTSIVGSVLNFFRNLFQ